MSAPSPSNETCASPKKKAVQLRLSIRFMDLDAKAEKVAQRYLLKRTKRSSDLSGAGKVNSTSSKKKKLKAKSKKVIPKTKGDGEPTYFLGPVKISDVKDGDVKDNDKFVIPKHYVCEDCDKISLSMYSHLKHLRKHNLGVRCSGCNRTFDNSVLHKRRHELRCSKKARLKFGMLY